MCGCLTIELLNGLAPRWGGAIVLRADHDLLLSVTTVESSARARVQGEYTRLG